MIFSKLFTSPLLETELVYSISLFCFYLHFTSLPDSNLRYILTPTAAIGQNGGGKSRFRYQLFYILNNTPKMGFDSDGEYIGRKCGEKRNIKIPDFVQ